MRRYIYGLLHNDDAQRRDGVCYDWFIMIVAIISIVPMMFRDNSAPIFKTVESVTVYILFFDYVLRWITNDMRMKNNSAWAFFIYPFTPLALMDIAGRSFPTILRQVPEMQWQNTALSKTVAILQELPPSYQCVSQAGEDAGVGDADCRGLYFHFGPCDVRV